jgi:hypothetical protein
VQVFPDGEERSRLVWIADVLPDELAGVPHPLVTQLRFTRSEWIRGLKAKYPRWPFFFKQRGGRTSKAGARVLDGRTCDELPRVP